VERMDSGSGYREIGFIRGSGTSSTPQTWHYYDRRPQLSGCFYRIRQQDYDGTTAYSREVGISPAVPSSFTLSPAWPNPFNGRTAVRFVVPQAARLIFAVYNIRGERVRFLANALFQSGEHQVVWDGRDDSGRMAGSGTYFIRMTDGPGGVDLLSKVFYLR